MTVHLSEALLVALTLIVSHTTAPRRLAEGVIVGRARCGADTWLLTDARELTRLSAAGEVGAVSRLSGLKADDRPWGLACLGDGTLWTLAAPRALARLTEEGRIVDRIETPRPRVALFGAGDRLLFQPFPVVAGESALQTAPPRQPASVRGWPGLVSRGSRSREAEIAHNLITCGISASLQTPCWFVDARSFAIADVSQGREVDLPAALVRGADADAPIRDVALAGASQWVLLGGRRPPALQPSGVRLLQRHGEGPWSAVDLEPPARLIVSATAARCVLLGLDGRAVQVRVTP